MPGSLVVTGGRVLTPKGWVEGDLLVEGGKVARVGKAGKPKAGAVVLDAKGGRVLPGLIDLQINGAFAKSFSSATPAEIGEVALGLAKLGVTGFLASVVSLPPVKVAEAMARVRDAAQTNTGAEILGAHLEGPFLNHERAGAHRRENIRPPNLVEFSKMAGAGDGIAKMMTIAPETKGAASIIAAGVKRGMVMALGHSLAGAADVDEAVRAGATVVTHLFNAMPPFHHRERNLVTVALTEDRLTCACIYDRHHISREAMTVALRCKPAGRLVLVSDATAALGAPDGSFDADGTRYTVKGGQVTVKGTATLGGSASSLLDGVRNVAEDLGVLLEEAWRLGSAAAARAIGLGDSKGELAPGRDGDLVVLDDDWSVRAAAVRGTVVHGSRD